MILVSLSFGCSGVAKTCPQGAARYVEKESGAYIAFSSFDENLSVMHQFSLGFEGKDLVLSGYVLAGGEPLRPVGLVQHNCPDGDVTGEELTACTIWEGVIYGTDKNGNINLLPGAQEAAVQQILLPEFTHALLSHPVSQELELGNMPFEVFDDFECEAG